MYSRIVINIFMYLHPNDDAKYNMKKCSRKYMSESLHQKKGDENTQNLLH